MTTSRPASGESPNTTTPCAPVSVDCEASGWTTIAGAVTTPQITDAAHRVAASHDLIAAPYPGALRLLDGHSGEEVLIRWRLTEPPGPSVLAYHPTPTREQHQQVLVSSGCTERVCRPSG